MIIPDNRINQHSLNPHAARHLSHTTKSLPMMEEITPRWLLSLLPWVSVESGIYRVNRLKKATEENVKINEYGEKRIEAASCAIHEYDLPVTYPDYEECPGEYMLSLVQTILQVNTNVTDIFNVPINQFQEQTRLTVEAMKERQEMELINNPEFGLLHQATSAMRVQSRKGSPTPDDLDELLSKVWKKPAFFLAHPRAIAAFGRECTLRGVPPVAINIFGSPFITWRGVPLIPCDKLLVDGKCCNTVAQGKTNILLMRTGEKEQGVIGLHQPGVPDEIEPSLSMKFAGINNRSVASYILSLYFSVAVLAKDALAVLENVEVGSYRDDR